LRFSSFDSAPPPDAAKTPCAVIVLLVTPEDTPAWALEL
jgi:hypothetical protein